MEVMQAEHGGGGRGGGCTWHNTPGQDDKYYQVGRKGLKGCGWAQNLPLPLQPTLA